MIQVNREYDTALRIEASAETRNGASGNERCSWWLLAELGVRSREDRIFSAEQRGSLVYDRRGTYVFALGDRCESTSQGGLAMTRSSLQDALQTVPAGDPLRGEADERSPRGDAFGRTIDSFVATLHERTCADGVGALVVIRWPDLFFVPGSAAVGYVMHDGRLQQIEDDRSVRVSRRSGRCLAAAASVGLAGVLPREELSDAVSALAVSHVSLAFGDALLLCSPTVANYVPPAQMARTLRASGSAQLAASSLLDSWQRCGCQREATALVTRFTFRGLRPTAPVDTAQN